MWGKGRPVGKDPDAWARLRFSIIGGLLSSPPKRGQLQAKLLSLSAKDWTHPITGEPVRFAKPTIERWFYKALHNPQDPVGALRRTVRKDLGQQTALSDRLVRALLAQYRTHRSWSYKLHADNLGALVREDPRLGPMPSYASVVRCMKARGLIRRKRRPRQDRPGERRAEARFDQRETRSYEVEYVGALWHLDFHASTALKVVGSSGCWVTPQLLGILDDYSRLTCHAQWYLDETVQSLVHGLSQAFQKRGLPRSAMMDNGSAMKAAEVIEGLERLGVLQDFTLPYSPEQNGKQESFWGTVEGRLMAMLEGVKDLTLEFLNEATQAWLEMEYNRRVHSEIQAAPLDRFLSGPDVSRPCPSSVDLRHAFRQKVFRTQRRSDGTVTIDGKRFEIPSRFRHLRRVCLHYPRWNLAEVHMVDDRSGTMLAPIYPLDKARNADGRRRVLDPVVTLPENDVPTGGVAPLLKQLMADYAATGLPPAYLPKHSGKEPPDEP